MYTKPVVADFSSKTIRYIAMVLILVANFGYLNANAHQPDQMSSHHQSTHEALCDLEMDHVSHRMDQGGCTADTVHSHMGENIDGQCYEGGCCPGSSMTTGDCWSPRSAEHQTHRLTIAVSYLSVAPKVAGHPPK